MEAEQLKLALMIFGGSVAVQSTMANKRCCQRAVSLVTLFVPLLFVRSTLPHWPSLNHSTCYRFLAETLNAEIFRLTNVHQGREPIVNAAFGDTLRPSSVFLVSRSRAGS